MKTKKIITGLMIMLVLSGILMSGCTAARLSRKLTDYEKEQYQLMKYFATRKEYIQYLKLPAEERPLYLEDFWRMYDPDIKTRRNEFYIEVKRRYKYADRKYKELKTPGHMTSRGRIYILFGEPDDISRGRYSPSASETRGLDRDYFSEIWTYYEPNQMEFVFIDEYGLGTYSLSKDAPTTGSIPTNYIPNVKKPPYRLRTMEEVQQLKEDGYF